MEGAETTDLPLGLVEEATRRLSSMFGAEEKHTFKSRLHAPLVSALVRAAMDPDDVLGSWASDNTPLGVGEVMESRGIFPPAEPWYAPTEEDWHRVLQEHV